MSDKTRPTILLEDDATLRALMVEGLEQAGHAVIEAPTDRARRGGPGGGGGPRDPGGRPLDRGGRSATGSRSRPTRWSVIRCCKVVYISGTHIAVRRRALGERERALLKPFAMTQLLAALRDLGR